MLKNRVRLLSLILLTSLLSGCVMDRVNLRSVKSDGVDRIPLKLGIYPFLSTPLSSTVHRGSILSLGLNMQKDSVAITPPADTDLRITQESQILTDGLSTALSAYGFTLKQLPVEVQEPKDKNSKDPKTFYISMNLLRDLQEKYGVEAIALCDAFFIQAVTGMGSSERRVVSAHVKIVDIKSLDVLAQVSLPYNADGSKLDLTSDEMALSLARLAGKGPATGSK